MKSEDPEHQMQRIKRSDITQPKTTTTGSSDQDNEKVDKPHRKPLHPSGYADLISDEEFQDFTHPQEPTDAAQT